jgi:hypothetical protein
MRRIYFWHLILNGLKGTVMGISLSPQSNDTYYIKLYCVLICDHEIINLYI